MHRSNASLFQNILFFIYRCKWIFFSYLFVLIGQKWPIIWSKMLTQSVKLWKECITMKDFIFVCIYHLVLVKGEDWIFLEVSNFSWGFLFETLFSFLVTLLFDYNFTFPQFFSFNDFFQIVCSSAKFVFTIAVVLTAPTSKKPSLPAFISHCKFFLQSLTFSISF